MQRSDDTSILQGLIDRIHAGDASARPILLERACERLRRIVRRELRGFPLVRRWEETDDVLQGTMMRLSRALEQVQPASLREFLALFGTLVRRELIDLKRHHYGPQGPGAHHATHRPADSADMTVAPPDEPSDTTNDPAVLADWTEFHEHVERLPEEEREVFNLLWYQELSRPEAAAVLELSVKTVNRRWREARLLLMDVLKSRESRGK